MLYQSPVVPDKFFHDLDLSHQVLNQLPQEFEHPIGIQAEAIPLIMRGHNLVASAETGSGKTAAFALPILDNILADGLDRNFPVALVLSPTRDLALQTALVFDELKPDPSVQVVSCIGGVRNEDIVEQLRQQRGPQVISGTLGCVARLIRKGHLDLSRIKTLVFDEADTLLNGEESRRVRTIAEASAQERQTLMLSATISYLPNSAFSLFNKEPIILARASERIHAQIEHQLYLTSHIREKFSVLMHLVQTTEMPKSVTFLNARSWTNSCYEAMNSFGLNVTLLSGDLSQPERMQNIKDFRNDKYQYLVATDVASRGLQFDNLSHVINFDFPRTPCTYLHRCGRTGRAGLPGTVINFTNYHNIVRGQPELIENEFDLGFTKIPVPRDNLLELPESLKPW